MSQVKHGSLTQCHGIQPHTLQSKQLHLQVEGVLCRNADPQLMLPV